MTLVDLTLNVLCEEREIASLEFYPLALLLVTVCLQTADWEGMFSTFKRIQGSQATNISNYKTMFAIYQANDYEHANKMAGKKKQDRK